MEPEHKDCIYLPRDGSDIITSASNNIGDKDQMNKQEEELIQFIVDQTQIDRDTIIRILNYRGVTELSEKYEKALEDVEDLNVDSRIALESAASILRIDVDKKGNKSKLNNEALKEPPETVIQICQVHKGFYYRFLEE